jgi:hypothetical protein
MVVGVSGLLPEPAGYAELLGQLKARVRTSQVRAARAANSELLQLRWSVGRDPGLAGTGRLGQPGDRPARDRPASGVPDQRGWSRRNLPYMRSLPRPGQPPRALCHGPWHNCPGVMSGCCSTAQQPLGAGLVRRGHGRVRVLPGRAGPPGETRLAGRVGSAPSNFAAALPAPDSELAQQLVRDPYVFDHLVLSGRVVERELEQALMDRFQDTLLAFGHGTALLDQQVRRAGAGLSNVEQLRYVVVELKIGRFDPGPTSVSSGPTSRSWTTGSVGATGTPHGRDLAVQEPQRHPGPRRLGRRARPAGSCGLHLRHPAAAGAWRAAHSRGDCRRPRAAGTAARRRAVIAGPSRLTSVDRAHNRIGHTGTRSAGGETFEQGAAGVPSLATGTPPGEAWTRGTRPQVPWTPAAPPEEEHRCGA